MKGVKHYFRRQKTQTKKNELKDHKSEAFKKKQME